MTDLFTPVEVSNNDEDLSEGYELSKFNIDPFQPATAKIQSLGDHRKKIIAWLKNMPLVSRIAKLTFTNKQFACLVMAMYDRGSVSGRCCLKEFGISYSEQHGFKINQQRVINRPNSELLVANQHLLSSICIGNCYSTLDSIGVDFSLATDVQKMFDIFDIIQNGVSHQITNSNYKAYLPENSHFMFYSSQDTNITKTLGLWFVEVIKKNLSVQYFLECKKSFGDLKINQRTQRLKQKSKNFKIYWNQLDSQQRLKKIKSATSKDIRKILNQYQSTVKIFEGSFPFIKYCHPEQFDCFVQDICELNGEYLLEQLTYIQIQDSLFDFALLKYEILLDIEQQIQKNREKKKIVKQKKFGNILPKMKNGTILIIEKPQQIKTLITKQIIKHTPRKSNQGKDQQIKKSKEKKKDKKQNKYEVRNQTIQSHADSKEQYSMSVGESQSQIKENQILAQNLFNKAVIEFENKTMKWKKCQQIAINRLESVLKSCGLSFNIFGSFTNGLGICQSDVDVCIDPNIVHFFYASFCSYREKIIKGLQYLQNYIQMMNWACDFNLITTASVPRLVFNIDLSVVYGDPKNDQLNLKRPQKNSKICMDLTIQPFANLQKQTIPHLGYQSTALVTQWTCEFKSLSSLVKLVKHLLYHKNFTKSFTGGLSSYAITNMLYSFLKAEPSRDIMPLRQILIQFCQFFSHFNENQYLIDAINCEPFVKIKQNRGLIVINCLNRRNITQNCHLFDEIKSWLNIIANQLKVGEHFSLKDFNRSLKSFILQ